MKSLTGKIPVLFLFYLFSCGGSESENVAPPGNQEPSAPVEADANIISERKLIKTGEVSFETGNLAQTQKKVHEAVAAHDGYIGSEDQSRSAGRISNTIVIRVPNANFDPLLNTITAGVEHLDHKTISVDDVTEEFLDAEARIKTKKELELRYHELLKEAKTVAEMLEIEKQIGDLRTEIESMEGRLKFLENQVAYSTLTVTFYEKMPEDNQWGGKFGESISNGWDALIYFCLGLVTLWPFIILSTITWLFVRRYNRRKKLVKKG